MEHVTTSGQSVSRRYSGLPSFEGHVIRPPSLITGCLLGYAGTGKTNLMLTNPDAFVFNLDMSSTTTADVKATMWPGINAAGEIIDTDDKPLHLQWERAEEIIEVLKGLPVNNRPKTVCFDSLSAVIRLLKEYIPRNAQKHKIHGSNVTEWNYLHGPSAWDWVYTRVEKLVVELASAGYGVWFIGHIAEKEKTIGEGDNALKVSEPSLVQTDNFWARILDMFEYVGVLQRERIKTTVTPPLEEYTDPKTGQKKTRQPPARAHSYEARVLYTKELNVRRGLMKERVDLPKIEIPPVGGWGVFTAEYQKAIARAKEQTS